jgi:hypothetical protein
LEYFGGRGWKGDDTDVCGGCDCLFGSATDLDVLAQVQAAHGADPATTAANIVELASAFGFDFTAAEYQNEVESEIATILKLHRAVPHHILLTVT